MTLALTTGIIILYRIINYFLCKAVGAFTMKKFIRYTLPLGLIVLSVAAVVALVTISNSKRPEKKDEIAKAILVEVIPVQLESLNLLVNSQGTVLPRTETVVIAEVAGKVVNVSPNFVSGGFFRKGEVLLQIDPSDYEAAVMRADANLASRQAQLADQQARSDQALKDWKNLGRSGDPSDLTLRKPQLAEAKAGVQAAEADLQKAKRDLDRTRIKASYDGLVRTKQVDIGQYVGPGTSLGVTFAIDKAEVRLPLAIDDLQFIHLPAAMELATKNQVPVRLSAESSGLSGEWTAEIVRTEGVIDRSSRVIYAVAQITDPYGVLGQNQLSELRMGTFVSAEIQGLWMEDIIALPRSALHEGNTVLVASPENELEIRHVEILRSEPKVVYVQSGLKSGDKVITTAIEAALPGSRLVISKESDTLPPEPETTAAARTSL
jgi:RND family efflux transporter MFP subunit